MGIINNWINIMKKEITKIKDSTLVINWHLLEPCQFKCKYCYAQWDKANLPQVYKNNSMSEKLIDELLLFKKQYKNVRLSLAGGEPLLDKNIEHKIIYAYNKNLKVSIITNGDLLTEKFILDNAKYLDILGLSIDSMNDETNIKIGRATLTLKLPKYNEIINLIKLAKKINPKIKIKINTVVNRFNFNENMRDLIKDINPDKWKIFQVLPTTNKAKSEIITTEKFNIFANKHKDINCAMFEDNNIMLASYLMIDPFGRFFANSDNTKNNVKNKIAKGADYAYSSPILNVGIMQAFEQIEFNFDRFINRY
jgi:radical S-adenosyl methionine domain-containing protein 2